MGKNVVVISAHPDDETLGCGGTILKMKEEGHSIFWVIITRLSKNVKSECSPKRRKLEIEEVYEAYGFDDLIQLSYPSTRLGEFPSSDLIEHLGKALSDKKANTVFFPWQGDVHTDHRITFLGVMSSSKKFRLQSLERLLCYEVISETEESAPLPDMYFRPNVFIDITPYIDKKCQIMRIYKSELKASPFPRSIETIRALAAYRGAVRNVKFAEAFMLIREMS